jgi:hypothetical protein
MLVLEHGLGLAVAALLLEIGRDGIAAMVSETLKDSAVLNPAVAANRR